MLEIKENKMDITSLYELRNRLRTAMIAGTNLLSDDFRLGRAVEAVKPLEKIAPVFAKIGELGRNLIAPEQADKVDALLQAITLVDAVLCTQGAVGVLGEIEEIKTNNLGITVTNAPYSVVKALIEALTSSGSGHYSYVLDVHSTHPELFADYRVKAAMVQALGAGYAELAETVAEWLKEEGEEILLLLQKDFNPKGKKEMMRRVHVIEAIAGAKANDFYRKQLPEAEKEVRQALIYALRHSLDNLELLIEMTKTERGNTKKTACLALVHMEDERAGEFFQKMAEKKAQDVMEYIFLSDTKWASALTAEILKKQLLLLKEEREEENFCITKEQSDFWLQAFKALIGKSGDEILEVYHIAAEFGQRLNLPLAEGNYSYYYYYTSLGTEAASIPVDPLLEACDKTKKRYELLLAYVIPHMLQISLFANPDRRLCELAVELYENGSVKERRTKYFPAALTAKLLLGEDCCNWLSKELQIKENDLYRGLIRLSYNTKEKQYMLGMKIYNTMNGEKRCYKYLLGQKLGGKFMDILIEYDKMHIEDILCNCINSEDKESCGKLEKYFYKKALKETSLMKLTDYFRALRTCGCNRCEGLFQNYLLNKKNIQRWEIVRIAEDMPGTNAVKLDEMIKALELVHEGKAKLVNCNETEYINIMERFR